MTNQLIWASGLCGYLLLIGVLFARKRAAQYPWFTLLIVFYFLRSVGLAAVLRFSGHPVRPLTALVIDAMDVLLQLAVLAELTWIALRPLPLIRRITLPLLLLASGVILVIRVAPAGYTTPRAVLLLCHFMVSVLMLEWAVILTVMLRPLGLSWRSHVFALSLGFGVYSAALLGAGGYFTTAREMRAFVFFSFLRISVYLAVLLFWVVRLALPEAAAAERAM